MLFSDSDAKDDAETSEKGRLIAYQARMIQSLVARLAAHLPRALSDGLSSEKLEKLTARALFHSSSVEEEECAESSFDRHPLPHVHQSKFGNGFNAMRRESKLE